MNRVKLHWLIQETIDGPDPFEGPLLWMNFTCDHDAHDKFEVHILANSEVGWRTVQEDYAEQLESIKGITVVEQSNRLMETARYRVLIYCCEHK